MPACGNAWKTSEAIFDVDRKRQEITALEKKMAAPQFWEAREEAQKMVQRRGRLQEDVDLADRLGRELEDLQAFFKLAQEVETKSGEDAEALDELLELTDMEARVARLETEMILSGEHDPLNAIVTIHPGAGGTESQDWAQMLLRMYLRWAEAHNYETTLLDLQPGEEAGIKSATFLVKGSYAFGHLAPESGVHRLVRISPFDASSRRHTSFASVFVYPEIEDKVEVQIEEKDLKVDTFRASGPGGQHVNVTDSAVRITHLPTGIVVQCQNERSQHKNRTMAMKILRGRLYELELEKKRKELEAVEESKKEIGWGSQIRSYVLHPYRMAKDHRTKMEVGDVDRVLDGDIDPFIHEFLLRRRERSQAGRDR